ncbi:MAG: hypothetical protein L6R28_22125 [Planctomycetes bacterium]|nr:hypothetical protein [Planctomycetota bacterium]
MVKWITICSAVLFLPLFSGCGAKTAATEKTTASTSDGHAHAEHAHKGIHGGKMIALDGEKAHIEFVHHAAEGEADLYITGPDGKTALPLEKAPNLKLMTDDGPKVLKCEPSGGSEGKASQFTASGDALKKDPLKGFIAVEVDGASFSPALPEEHHHSH